MNEKNKFKILLTDNSFDITLNPGESMDLHVKNQDGKVYLSSIPTQSNESNASISINDVFIHNGYKSVSYESSNHFDNSSNVSEGTNKVQSSIYDLLSKKNHIEDSVEEENPKYSQQDFIESDSINENAVETIKQAEVEEVQKETEKTIEEEQPSQNGEEEPEKSDSNIEVLKRKYFPIDEDEE